MPTVTNGNGWLRGWPDPYYYKGFINGIGAQVLIKDTSQDANTYKTWAEAFQRYVTDKGGTNDPSLANVSTWDGVSIMQTQSSAAYFLWRLGGLRLAQGLGIPGADESATWLASQLPAQLQKYGGTNDPRFSFSSN
jgi:hypothetical protein